MSQIKYKAHVQYLGWLKEVEDGEIAGTTGESRRLEGIIITDLPEGVETIGKVHLQDIGWVDNIPNGENMGTEAQERRLEAISIKLAGPKGSQYDIYYRLHIQDRGWLDWSKNGEYNGTIAGGIRAEAIQIMLREKSEKFTLETDQSYAYDDMTAYMENLRRQEEARRQAELEAQRQAQVVQKPNEVVALAQSQLGYTSGTSQDSAYGRIYVGVNAGDWCCFFTRWIYDQCGVTFPPTGYCPYVVDWAKQNGRWTGTPKPGYAVLYDFNYNGVADHIGVVEQVINGGVVAIEGNTGDPVGVYRKTRTDGILGYVNLF